MARQDAETAKRLQEELWAQAGGAGGAFPPLGEEKGEEEEEWKEVALPPKPRAAPVPREGREGRERPHGHGGGTWEWGIAPSGVRSKTVCRNEWADGTCHFGGSWYVV